MLHFPTVLLCSNVYTDTSHREIIQEVRTCENPGFCNEPLLH